MLVSKATSPGCHARASLAEGTGGRRLQPKPIGLSAAEVLLILVPRRAAALCEEAPAAPLRLERLAVALLDPRRCLPLGAASRHRRWGLAGRQLGEVDGLGLAGEFDALRLGLGGDGCRISNLGHRGLRLAGLGLRRLAAGRRGLQAAGGLRLALEE